MRNKGIIYVFTGSSGAGKGVVCQHVLETFDKVIKVPSYTTRDPRDGEVNGEDYYFVNRAEFEEREKLGKFLETAEVYGNLYGTLKNNYFDSLRLGLDVVKDIDIQGARAFKEIFGDRCVTVFVKPPSLDVLKERLLERDGVLNEDRLKQFEYESDCAIEFDYIMLNDDLEDSKQIVNYIVNQERNPENISARFERSLKSVVSI